MIFTHTIFKTTFFSHQLCTLSFTPCLSKKLKKQNLKYFLITDVINLYILGSGQHMITCQDLLKLYHKDNTTHTIYNMYIFELKYSAYKHIPFFFLTKHVPLSLATVLPLSPCRH